MDSIDLVVVGGGPGGAYTAMRYANADAGTVRLYEASDHIGGRLDSPRPPGGPDLDAEFGGMGWSSDHTFVSWLVAVLGLPTRPFPNGATSYSLLRGVHLVGADATNPSKLPYRFTTEEAALIDGHGGAVLVRAMVKASLGVDPVGLTHEDWLNLNTTFIVPGYNLRLREIGLWNYLATLLSPEAHQYVVDEQGHIFPTFNGNALDMLEWYFADFRTGVTYTWLQDGYQSLPERLASDAVTLGAEIQLSTSVTSITASATPGRLTVNLDDGTAVDAGRVVLALPRRAIELITPGSIVLDDEPARSLIASVEGVPVMKLFLVYDSPWWESGNGPLGSKQPEAFGNSRTTLPLRTTYYFGSERTPSGGPGTNETSLLMASYTDGVALTFWEGLRAAPVFQGRETQWTQQFPGDPLWLSQPATTAMVEAATQQLNLLHDRTDVPAPIAAAYRDWGVDPVGGATYVWNPGIESDTVMGQLQQPDPNVPLHIIGSAYSHQQGWVEGAFRTAERFLQEHVGLPPIAGAPNLPPVSIVPMPPPPSSPADGPALTG